MAPPYSSAPNARNGFSLSHSPSASPNTSYRELSTDLLRHIDTTKLTLEQVCGQTKQLLNIMEGQSQKFKELCVINNQKTSCLGEMQQLKCDLANCKQRLIDHEAKETKVMTLQTELVDLRAVNTQLHNQVHQQNSVINDLMQHKNSLEETIALLGSPNKARYHPAANGRPQSVQSGQFSNVDSPSDQFSVQHTANPSVVSPHFNGCSSNLDPSSSQYAAAGTLTNLHLMQSTKSNPQHQHPPPPPLGQPDASSRESDGSNFIDPTDTKRYQTSFN